MLMIVDLLKLFDLEINLLNFNPVNQIKIFLNLLTYLYRLILSTGCQY